MKAIQGGFWARLLMALLMTADSSAAEAAVPDPVVVVDRGNMVSVSNGLITIEFDKSNGTIVSLSKGTVELTGKHDMYFDMDWTWAPGGLQKKLDAGATRANVLHSFAPRWVHASAGDTEYRLASHDEGHAHICFANPAEHASPIDVEVHYVLRRGDSGFYCYVVNRRKKDEAPLVYVQSRYVMRIRDGIFNQKAVPPDRIGNKLFSAEEMGKSHQYADAERFPDGSVETKYDWSVYEGNQHVYGITGSGLGLWVISASSEYVNGGPTKQNLSVEENEVSIVLLRMFQSAHFGSGSLFFDRGEDWSKVYGPFFVYLNAAEDFDALWADAKKRAEREVDAWPHSWVRHELYPLQRGTVRGRLRITDGSSPDGAWVILAAPAPDWQYQGKGYIFWAQADGDGNFEIPKVRPGRYSLYATVSGVMDEFRLDDIRVDAGSAADLGTLRWRPLSYGRRVWQIGVPDRSGREYRHGDDFHHWGLWLKYPEEFPDDVNFTIGVSTERRDWNYVHPAVLTPAGTYRFPVWRIHFEMPEAPAYGQAVLRMPLAEVTSYGLDQLVTLKVSVNGTEVSRFTEYGDDSGVNRSTIQGLYRDRTVCFDAGLLQKGKNTIALTYDAKQRSSPLEGWPLVSVVYDCLRLEINQVNR